MKIFIAVLFGNTSLSGLQGVLLSSIDNSSNVVHSCFSFLNHPKQIMKKVNSAMTNYRK